MNAPMRTRRVSGVLSLAVAMAMVLANLAFSDRALGLEFPQDGPVVDFTTPLTVPVVDSPMGHGADLVAHEPVHLPAGPDADAAHSALVRISVFEAPTDLQISMAGAVALSVAADTSASTTVLVPVANGEFTLASTADVAVRVEVLATFRSDAGIPGSTIPLPEAVDRPGEGITVSASPADGAEFGLTGLGGVPSEGVRSVHVSLTLEATEATSLSLGGQELSVEQGVTTISTIVSPDVNGAVQLDTTADVEAHLVVRGWVAEAADYAGALNGPGSFWPEPVAAASSHELDDEGGVEVELPARADASHVLALVAADPAEHITTIDMGSTAGRSEGVLLDPVTGAQPQLTIMSVDDPVLTLGRGVSTAHVQVLGSIIGNQPVASSAAASIQVSSPEEGMLDLDQELAFTFEGTAEAGDLTPLRIEVHRNGDMHGFANVVPTSTGLGWEVSLGVQQSGDYTYEFILVGRDGATATTQWSAHITIPGEDDLILHEDVVVLGWPGTDMPILGTTDDHVDFGAAPGFLPGEVITGGITDGSPVGLLRRAVAIDELEDRWRVTTEPATFEDVFLQVDRTSLQPLIQPDAPAPEIEYRPAPEDSEAMHEITSHRRRPVEDVDLSEREFQAEPTSLSDDEIDITLPYEPLGGGFGVMAAPVPKERLPLDSGGPAKPPPSHAIAFEGETKWADSWSHTFTDKSLDDDTTFELTGELDLTLRLVFKLKAAVQWEMFAFIPYPKTNLELLETYIQAEAAASVEGTAGLKTRMKLEPEGMALKYKLAPTTVFVGPVPVVITYDVGLVFKANITASAAVELSFNTKVQLDVRFGVAVRKGKGELIDEANFTYDAPEFGEDPVLGGKLSASAGPEFSFNLRLYDAAGPSVGLGLQAGVSAELTVGTTGSKVKVQIFLTGNMFARVEVTVPIINWKLASWTLLDEKFKWSLFDWTYDLLDLFPGPDPTEEPTPDPTEEPTPDPTEEPTPDPTIGPSDPSALEFARAIEIVAPEPDGNSAPVQVLSASWIEGPPSAASHGIVEGNFDVAPGRDGALTKASYPALSTGSTTYQWSENQGYNTPSTRGPGVWDATSVRIQLDRPPAMECVSID